MKKLLFFVCLFFFVASYSQNYKITYLKSSNGTLLENQDAVLVFSNANQTLLTTESIFSQKAALPYEQTSIDRSNSTFSQFAVLNAKQTIATKDSTSLAKQTFELLNGTKKILGYDCKKAKTVVNSNTI